jgi:hypothetical protein
LYGPTALSFNPYQAPATAEADAVGTDAAVSHRIVESLRKAKPWVSLVAFSGFMIGGSSVLLGLMVLFFAPEEELSGVVGIGYLVWGGITLGAAIPLRRFGRGIRRLLHGGGMAELEYAIEAQTRFWQLAGVTTLISLILLIGAIGLFIFAAAYFSSIF